VTVALVTGITGQDGAYLTKQLLEEGHRVVGLVRPGTVIAGPVREFIDCAELVSGDLRDDASLRSVLDQVAPDEVYNLAGMSSVSGSWESPLEQADVNGVGVLRLALALLARAERTGHQARLLQASSAEIFGPTPGAPRDESSPIQPRNPYAVAKAFGHEVVATYRESCGLHASTVILFNHESPLRTTAFVSRKISRGVAEIALGRAERLVLGNLDAQRDWGFAGDYTRAMRLAMRHSDPGDWVVATGQVRSVRDFVREAFAVVGIDDWEHRITTAPEFVRPAESPVLLGDPAKARRELGWEPEVSFSQLVATMVQADLDDFGRSVEPADAGVGNSR
jgi:GDPmannose 4,6-dehydratase